MSLDGLNSPNSPRKIDHPNYTSFSKKQLIWITYFKIISRKHGLKISYVKIVPWFIQKQKN